MLSIRTLQRTGRDGALSIILLHGLPINKFRDRCRPCRICKQVRRVCRCVSSSDPTWVQCVDDIEFTACGPIKQISSEGAVCVAIQSIGQRLLGLIVVVSSLQTAHWALSTCKHMICTTELYSTRGRMRRRRRRRMGVCSRTSLRPHKM